MPGKRLWNTVQWIKKSADIATRCVRRHIRWIIHTVTKHLAGYVREFPIHRFLKYIAGGEGEQVTQRVKEAAMGVSISVSSVLKLLPVRFACKSTNMSLFWTYGADVGVVDSRFVERIIKKRHIELQRVPIEMHNSSEGMKWGRVAVCSNDVK